jgi:NTP pyrophosphatase (non-canonical NTP hydrolase)
MSNFKYRVGSNVLDIVDSELFTVSFVDSSEKPIRIGLIDSVGRLNIFTENYLFTHFSLPTISDNCDKFKKHVEQFTQDKVQDNLMWRVSGLVEEAGEVLQIIRELEYKNKLVDVNHLKEELGDVLYYVQSLANRFGLTLDDIKQANIDKLNKRFPSGEYTTKDAIRKVDHE